MLKETLVRIGALVVAALMACYYPIPIVSERIGMLGEELGGVQSFGLATMILIVFLTVVWFWLPVRQRLVPPLGTLRGDASIESHIGRSAMRVGYYFGTAVLVAFALTFVWFLWFGVEVLRLLVGLGE